MGASVGGKNGDANRTVVLIPVCNDTEPLLQLVAQLADAMHHRPDVLHLVIVDDASEQPVPLMELFRAGGDRFVRVTIVRLRRNLGHQRAIAVGLSHVHEQVPCGHVVVMDGDGEDRPTDVPHLLAALDDHSRAGPAVIFAERTRRSESVMFRVFYTAYRAAHWMLTGIPVRFGNFSVLPYGFVSSLVVASELWNHYAAAVLKLRLPYRSIPTTRGQRLAGTAQMHFVALAVHGFSAISVFGEVVGVRLLVSAVVIMALLAAAFTASAIVAFSQGTATAMWATGMLAFGLVMIMQAVTTIVGYILFVLGSRGSTGTIPLRDYRWFVDSVISKTRIAARVG